MSTKSKSDGFHCVTCTAPVNIAVTKYWGKRDEKLILPTNPSISVTLGQEQLRTKTSAAVSKKYKEDRMWLNGIEQSINSPRIQNVLKEVRRRARKRGSGGEMKDEDLLGHVYINSENNFPTAAGLASSAAGYACLVFTLAKLYGVTGEISDIARQGSGSACRSIYGGFVEWLKGKKADGSDSYAQQIAPDSHWPEMRALLLVVSDQKKDVGSTEGMQTTIETSDLMKYRLQKFDERNDKLRESIKRKDFATFGKLTMEDSNQLHSVCLDTYPPIFYMTDTSRLIVRLVHTINDLLGEIKVCYTFDAGPNACLYLLDSEVELVVSLVNHFFPSDKNIDDFITGIPVKTLPAPRIQKFVSQISLPQSPGAIKYIISTKVGEGPQVLTDSKESLFDSNGEPKLISS